MNYPNKFNIDNNQLITISFHNTFIIITTILINIIITTKTRIIAKIMHHQIIIHINYFFGIYYVTNIVTIGKLLQKSN